MLLRNFFRSLNRLLVYSKLAKAIQNSDHQKVIKVLRKSDDETLDEISGVIEWNLQNSKFPNDTEREISVSILQAIKKHKSTMYWG